MKIKFLKFSEERSEVLDRWRNAKYVPSIGTKVVLADDSAWVVRDQITYMDLDDKQKITLWVSPAGEVDGTDEPPMSPIDTVNELNRLGRQYLNEQISFADLMEACRRIQKGEPPYDKGAEGKTPPDVIVVNETSTNLGLIGQLPHRAWIIRKQHEGKEVRTWCCAPHKDIDSMQDVAVYEDSGKALK